jgi:hypothetical protein
VVIAGGGTAGVAALTSAHNGTQTMLIELLTSDHEAHMSTRTTVCCMEQGQAAGTAAALCADGGIGARARAHSDLQQAPKADNVFFEN